MTDLAIISVSNWQNPEEYRLDSINALPDDFVKSLRDQSLSDKQILYVNMRWQFLRRHPRYQVSGAVVDGSMFGLQCTKCPSFYQAHPPGLLFYENSNGTTDPIMDWHLHTSQRDPAILSPLERLGQALAQSIYPAMKWPWFRFPDSSSGRLRDLSVKKLPILLRTIDALADGVSISRIEKDLGNHTDKAGRRLKAMAIQAMIDITKLEL